MSALLLRIIACGAMLLDHIGYAFHLTPLRIIGRIAFPIFVYLIYNGYRHTANPVKYALRLAIFAVIAQWPFTLMFHNGVLFSTGNVLVTLLLALICVWAADVLWKRRIGKWFCLLPAMGAVCLYLQGYLRSDYGMKGVLLAMVFWMLDGKALWKRLCVCVLTVCALFSPQIIGCMLGLLRGRGFVFSLTNWDRKQLWALLALPIIFAYNGEKGRMPGGKLAVKAAQLGFYAFYPVHILLIWLVAQIV